MTLSPRSWSERLYRQVTSPSVVWFGLPTAATWAVWTQCEQYGFVWRALASRTFFIRLGVALLIFGLGAGTLFGAAMRWAGFDANNRRAK